MRCSVEGILNDLVAVTGGDGFIGSHLVESLVARGFRVRAMAQYNAFGTWGWLDTLPKDARQSVDVVLGDVRDPRSVHEVMRGAATVYHLAALIAIPYSYSAPRSYLDTNATGTLNVLEAARELETPRVVHTSTSEVYGTALAVPISETHPLQAQSPYAASKIAGDKVAESYHRSFGVPVVTLRPFNTYGPRQSARAVIPTIITQLAAGERELHLGLLSPTRDFNYVTDTVEAFMAVGMAPADAVVGRVLNAGSGTETSIAEVVRTIGEILGIEPTISEDDVRLRPEDSEVMRLVCDATALKDATAWTSRVSLRNGLQETCTWFGKPSNLARYRWDRFNV
ncbi:MAG: GDP-mannose 4,6-dehydratase [Candidatus Limnocylindria bacterium]